MKRELARQIINHLWNDYYRFTPNLQVVTDFLKTHQVNHYHLDHFALIDLPSKTSGIAVMHKIFSLLNFETRGKDFLAEKQNDFLWMCESECEQQLASEVLPQVVVADFRLDLMPNNVKQIITRYADQTKPFPFELFEETLSQLHNASAFNQAITLVTNYFQGRDWPLPTIAEFNTVREFNELIAWVLIFGRRANHFTLAMHLQSQFKNLDEFMLALQADCALQFNQEGGLIKGGRAHGIAQSSTRNFPTQVALADGEIALPMGFVEFVWRYPLKQQQPSLWSDYYTGFIAQQANRVIESLYAQSTS